MKTQKCRVGKYSDFFINFVIDQLIIIQKEFYFIIITEFK